MRDSIPAIRAYTISSEAGSRRSAHAAAPLPITGTRTFSRSGALPRRSCSITSWHIVFPLLNLFYRYGTNPHQFFLPLLQPLLCFLLCIRAHPVPENPGNQYCGELIPPLKNSRVTASILPVIPLITSIP